MMGIVGLVVLVVRIVTVSIRDSIVLIVSRDAIVPSRGAIDASRGAIECRRGAIERRGIPVGISSWDVDIVSKRIVDVADRGADDRGRGRAISIWRNQSRESRDDTFFRHVFESSA